MASGYWPPGAAAIHPDCRQAIARAWCASSSASSTSGSYPELSAHRSAGRRGFDVQSAAARGILRPTPNRNADVRPA